MASEKQPDFMNVFVGLESTLSGTEGILNLRSKFDGDKECLGIIEFYNEGLSKALIDSEMKKYFAKQGFQVNYAEGAYWINKDNEKYILSTNTKENQITLSSI